MSEFLLELVKSENANTLVGKLHRFLVDVEVLMADNWENPSSMIASRSKTNL